MFNVVCQLYNEAVVAATPTFAFIEFQCFSHVFVKWKREWAAVAAIVTSSIYVLSLLLYFYEN